MLSIKNISLEKGGDKFLLKGISLEILKKEVSIFLGKSGSGKTSLLRCIAQLEKRYEGEIIHNKKDLSKTKPKE
ncbi:MAG: ATP-binding cassette domain-containing protein, partial [Verrucomicrobia bacterium]|nr:ATP-binding cassette domain-containing protein [Verrucomicrobiota bacterium]